MAKARNPNRDKAFKIYKKYFGKISAKEIAAILGDKQRNVVYWKKQDRWTEKYKPKGGAPKGNQNGIGNNGGAPHGNQNNRVHGFYSKHLPADTYDVFKDIEEMSPLDILWNNIKLKYVAIIRAQKIMFVKDQDDLTKEMKKRKIGKSIIKEDTIIHTDTEEEYELQFAWDKQANFLRAQSTAMGQLTNMIKKYDDMLHKDWDTVTEEQKARIEKIKKSIDNPEFKEQQKLAKEKMELAKERFEHQKKMDELKVW